MYCVSLNYKKAPLDVRQKFAFTPMEQKQCVDDLMKQGIVTGGILVCTCNRMELYVECVKDVEEDIIEYISKNRNIPSQEVKKYGMFFRDESLIRHLYRVVSGLDSMVIGEDEILHQMKHAYQFHCEHEHVTQTMHMIFQGAFACAKKTKNATDIQTTPVSMGTLTANAIVDFYNKHDIHAPVLVIGATGQIGSIIAKDIVDKGYDVIGTTRQRMTSSPFVDCRLDTISYLPFDQRYSVMNQVGAIVSCTTSPHYTVLKEDYVAHVQKESPTLFIDLAVPRDIDQSMSQLTNVTLYNVDFFKELAQENQIRKQGVVPKMDEIVLDAVSDMIKKISIRNYSSQHPEQFKQEWFQKMIGFLRDNLTAEQLNQLLIHIDTKQ